jgi:hypothetical protein
MFESKTKMGGSLGLTVSRSGERQRSYFWHVVLWKIRQFFAHRWREIPLWFVLYLVRPLVPGLVIAYGKTSLRKVCADGTVIDYGVAGLHLITTAGKNYVASCFDNTAEPENLKYHGFGTSSTAAQASDTTLGTELTTQYATDNTRPTGSQAHSTNTYTTVGTVVPDAAAAVTEWGLFSQAANSGGTLLDHQVFSVINLNGSGDSLAATYVLTIS